MKELLFGKYGYGLLGVYGPIIGTWRKFWWGMVKGAVCRFYFKKHDWRQWDYGYVSGQSCKCCRKTETY